MLQHLPTEILVDIIEFTETSSLINLILTCQSFNKISESNDVLCWKKRCELIFDVTLEKIQRKKWKVYCIQKYFNSLFLKILSQHFSESIFTFQLKDLSETSFLFQCGDSYVGYYDRKKKFIISGLENTLKELNPFLKNISSDKWKICSIGCFLMNKGELVENERMLHQAIQRDTLEETFIEKKEMEKYLPQKKGNTFIFCTDRMVLIKFILNDVSSLSIMEEKKCLVQ
jgi:hypothetical protein